ncbi:MAG: AraC family transcriptional regulator [Clostridia bacterium]|nr:AraC family transcriptional regulator [Clostridia bacterium]
MIENHDYFKGLRFEYGGRFSSREAWIHPQHTNTTWEIIFMIEGCAHLSTAWGNVDLNPGDFLLLPPGKPHSGYEYSKNSVSFFWLHFHAGPELEEIIENLPHNASLGTGTQMALLCRQLLHYSVLKDYPAQVSDALIGMILTEYEIHTRTQDKRHESRLLSDIREWIRINSDRRLDAKTVAEHFGYHEDHLTRLFRQRYGTGLKNYINEARTDKIRSLLLTTDLPLKEIAQQTGFDDYKAFLQYFTYHESVTPTALREQYYKTPTNNR